MCSLKQSVNYQPHRFYQAHYSTHLCSQECFQKNVLVSNLVRISIEQGNKDEYRDIFFFLYSENTGKSARGQSLLTRQL
jgi:hypothetical protein